MVRMPAVEDAVVEPYRPAVLLADDDAALGVDGWIGNVAPGQRLWSEPITAKAKAGRFCLAHNKLSNAGGGIERSLRPVLPPLSQPDEQGRAYTQPCPRHPLGCDGGF